ncbi:PLP-dependent aminotransferase family protein [Cohnella cellulosilytica]|uniref:PLP-dependent aminotransferase family protein n=1 Tax=Cohnella cellulosilytica TaxID=986710 RepID=A0ABW2F9E7_9BACL
MSSPFAYFAKLSDCGSKHLAMYLAIREAIGQGKLSPGEKLPSTRQLAALYGLSRGSVSLAYEMLSAEGFVQAGVGQGTFVAGTEREETGTGPSPDGRESGGETVPEPPRLTKWGLRLQETQSAAPRSDGSEGHYDGDRPADEADVVSFVPAGLGPDRFPWHEWKAEVAQQWRSFGASGAADGHGTEGSLALRKAIAGRLRRERGIPCREEDIVVTSGSMQAIALLSQLLLEEGKAAVIENPGYVGTRNAVKATGAAIVAGRTDGGGIVPRDWDAELLFVTPTRQFPTGVVLSYERRLSLLAWASRRGAWIVEDDYDSDFRWGGRPIEPLKALDREGRVVYVGTFSRSMSASMRIGFAVVPQELMQPFLLAKKLYDPYPTGIAEQQALANWMSSGGYDRHMRKMRRVLGKLENKLRACLDADLQGLFTAFPSDAGLHVYARWEGTEEAYRRLLEACLRRGVKWKDGSAYDIPVGEKPPPSALFGFSHLNERQIEDGVRRIRQAALALGELRASPEQGGNVHD